MAGADGTERSALDGRKPDQDLQQRLNAAFLNSKESRKQDSLPQEGEWRPQYQGRLRSFVEQKGFGFIDCQETYNLYGRDVFVHRFQIQESGVQVGQTVFFDIELNNKGHPQARNMFAANPNESMMWDMYNSWGYGGTYGGGYGNYNGGGYGYGGTNSGGAGSRERYNANLEQSASDTLPQFEEELRKCNSEQSINDIIETYGQHFTKGHVVAALYQLGLCRQKPSDGPETRNVGLATALLERVMSIQSKSLTADEASRVVWALAALEEVQKNERAAEYAMEIGGQARARFAEFQPAQMATLVGALSRMVRKPQDDQLVAEITTKFTDYSSGDGKFPKFPAQDMKIWTQFLMEASQPVQQEQPMAMSGAAQGMMPCQQMQGMGMGMADMQQQMQMRSMQDMQQMQMRQMQNMGNAGTGMSLAQQQQFEHMRMQQMRQQAAACGGCSGPPQMQGMSMKGGGPCFAGGGMMSQGCKGQGKGGPGMQGPAASILREGAQSASGMGMQQQKGMMPQAKGGGRGMQGDNSLLGGGNIKAGLPGMTGGSKGGPVGGFKGDSGLDFGKGASKGKSDKGAGKGKTGKEGGKGKSKGKDGLGKDNMFPGKGLAPKIQMPATVGPCPPGNVPTD